MIRDIPNVEHQKGVQWRHSLGLSKECHFFTSVGHTIFHPNERNSWRLLLVTLTFLFVIKCANRESLSEVCTCLSRSDRHATRYYCHEIANHVWACIVILILGLGPLNGHDNRGCRGCPYSPDTHTIWKSGDVHPKKCNLEFQITIIAPTIASL